MPWRTKKPLLQWMSARGLNAALGRRVVSPDRKNWPMGCCHGNGPARLEWPMRPISYARHQFPPTVIRHAVWLELASYTKSLNA